MILINN